jgi:cyclopropane fatty-acyl-phospholipid synthase-like methyltransferase
MDVTKLKFRDKFFDAVISFDIIEHLSEANQRKFLDEVRRVVKPTGMLIIGCPNAKVSMRNNTLHLRELTMSEFRDLLHQYFVRGYKIVWARFNKEGQKSEREVADLH